MNLRHLRKVTMLIPQLRWTVIVNRKPLPPPDDLRIYGEVTFNHEVLPRSETPTTSPRLSVSGRLDYGIGRVINRAGSAETQRRSRFQCFMVIVQAKAQFAVGLAVPQLLAYLACLRQSRLESDRCFSLWRFFRRIPIRLRNYHTWRHCQDQQNVCRRC